MKGGNRVGSPNEELKLLRTCRKDIKITKEIRLKGKIGNKIKKSGSSGCRAEVKLGGRLEGRKRKI